MIELLWEWLNFAARWLHVITGIAWIGSSFYFIALDLSLKKREGLPAGVYGDTWQVHGGGFYHMMKYTVAPATMPEELTWFKWESYATWLSGFFLICVLYYGSPELFLIDRSVADLAPWQAIGIGIAGLVLGWIVYDQLCKSPVGKNDLVLYAVLFVFVVVIGWAFTQVFSGRGAFIHTGALIATIMSANVVMIIIPNQKKVVASLLKGETPDPALGLQAKQRSTHNNYLTLPVLFLMLSNHYPLAYGTQYNWIIIALVLVMGYTIRHFFNSIHAGKAKPWWTWPATIILFIIAMWLSQAGPPQRGEEAASLPNAVSQKLVASADFDAVRDVVTGRCSMCHAREPVWEGLAHAPKSVYLEEDADIARHAEQIYVQAARSNAMPPGNVTELEPADRELLARWYEMATGQPRHLLW
ncbi:MAG: urate hydroxylase PuuD [Nitratireductor sp.]|nr:urate hydroxylase PuuD [Nitratireductor sp.]